MDTTALSDEILKIRERLAEIAEIRKQLPTEAFAERTELLDEEHQLEARLAELKDEASRAGAGYAEANASTQTDLTRPPNLPTD
jgi:predicted nuclease with TOPRIM domain